MRVLRRASSPTERSGGLIRGDWLTSAPKPCRSYFWQLRHTIVRPRQFFPGECTFASVRGILQQPVIVCPSREPHAADVSRTPLRCRYFHARRSVLSVRPSLVNIPYREQS